MGNSQPQYTKPILRKKNEIVHFENTYILFFAVVQWTKSVFTWLFTFAICLQTGFNMVANKIDFMLIFLIDYRFFSFIRPCPHIVVNIAFNLKSNKKQKLYQMNPIDHAKKVQIPWFFLPVDFYCIVCFT